MTKNMICLIVLIIVFIVALMTILITMIITDNKKNKIIDKLQQEIKELAGVDYE